MADNRKKLSDLEKTYRAQKQMSEQQIALSRNELNELSNVFNARKRISLEQDIQNEKQKIANAMQEAYNDASEDGYQITKQTTEALNKRIGIHNEEIKHLNKKIKLKKTLLNVVKNTRDIFMGQYDYLMMSDRVIRQTTLSLGMSANKAEMVRKSFEDSSAFVAYLGGDLEDIKGMMTGFADETGRARVLSADMLKDITLMGKGTSLGIDGATRLAAQFELVGVNVKSAMQFVEGVVETSELMGINTAAVLGNISTNFKKLQTFNFRQGVQGFSEMAQYAEKFKIDISSALDSAETSRNLENAIELAANLQVMGGEFAKTDPFELLFLARNDPAEYTKKINQMTAGLVTFRKNIDTGKFEKFISPADRDRIASVAKSLGMSTEELTEQALRMKDIQGMRQQMVGMGLSKKEKDVIEGMAFFNNQTGKFMVQIGQFERNINTLSKTEIEKLKERSISLEDRAKQAQTFDEAFKATINSLKTLMLPMIRGINIVLEKLRPQTDKLIEWMEKDNGIGKWIDKLTKMDFSGNMAKFGGMIMAGGFLFKQATGLFSRVFGDNSGKGGVKAGVGGLLGGVGKGVGGKGTAMAALGIGAGVGIGAAGIGAGLNMAGKGIKSISDAVKDLTPEQINSMKSILGMLPKVAAGIAGAGLIGTLGGPGIGIITAALMGLGLAVKMVGGGVGNMTNSFTELFKIAPNGGESLKEMGAGIGALSASLIGLQSGLGGALILGKTVKSIAKHSEGLKDVSYALNEINTLLTGDNADFSQLDEMIKSISNINTNKTKPLKQLTDFFKKPLQVEFADKTVAISLNVSSNIDGKKIAENSTIVRGMIKQENDMKNGQSA
jgi:hypothetical protein